MGRAKKKNWKEDDRVVVDFDGDLYFGSIAELIKTGAKVLFDDGEVIDVGLHDLQPLPQTISEEDFISEGFSQYNIQWDDKMTNFKFEAEGGKFYGWWRKTTIKGGGVAYAIDLQVEYEKRHYSVETIGYMKGDPRKDLVSLNADICASANKWFYHQCDGTFDTIQQLQQKADKPTLVITKLNTFDKIILDLKGCRDTSLRSGGHRVVTLTGDDPDNDPSGGVRIKVDLSSQAAALEGKVPPLLYESSALDSVTVSKSKRGKGKAERQEAIAATNQKNIEELLEALGKSRDKSEQRRIRSQLRRMGHSGGARSGSKRGGDDK